MKVSSTITIETEDGRIVLTKQQAESLYTQLAGVLNKTTQPVSPYPIINPAQPNVGPYPWTPGVTSYSIPCSDESGYHGVKCRSED